MKIDHNHRDELIVTQGGRDKGFKSVMYEQAYQREGRIYIKKA